MNQLNVLPYPAIVEYVGPDSLHVCTPTIQCDNANESLLQKAAYLQQALQQRFGTAATICEPNSSQQAPGTAISLQLVEQLQQLQQFRWREEGYCLACGAQGIQITALTTTGVFYGIQTLLQALQATPEGLRMPYTQVADAPRFIWRGVLLDVGRHFFPLPWVLKLLDLMALYKMNRFHWHLTEDQGWRLEVPSLPRLAEVGSVRGTPPSIIPLPSHNSSSSSATTASQQDGSSQQQQQQEQQQQMQEDSPQQQQQQQQDADEQDATDAGQQQEQREGTPPADAAAAAAAAASICRRAVPTAAAFHGGYYSSADVAAVVAYAAERGIEVVPEIELPGHCCAALAAYPNLSCTGEVTAVSTHWGIHEDVYCAGNDDVFSFLGSIFDQAAVQFPCRYVHIGGDEVPKARWQACAKCQERMRQEGLANEAELQSWFVRKVSGMLAARGRQLIGWDEILEGGLAEGATVMSWRGNVGGIIAAKSGHDVIMTPTSHCYFDYRQAPSACEPGAWYACLPLHVVYQYDPIPSPWPDAAAASPAAAAGGDEAAVHAAGDCDGGSSEAMQLESREGSGEHSSASMSHSHHQDGSGEEEGEEQQGQGPSPAAAAAAGGAASAVDEDAVMSEQDAAAAAGAVAAAGPHFPGDPPGASLTALLPAAASAAAAASNAAPASTAAVGAGSSSSSSRAAAQMLSEDEAAHILGSQANLWCEYVQDEETAEYMLLPRLAALAESVWTPVAVKDWGRFSSRLQRHLPLLQQMGYKYRPLS
uniref:beta-N-acetylhexosaminidase n=1 Tax=Tetradesmus obliquus TaxID=3088 RepID=A0A383VT24_TETOB|eukprot:jgi/Sobl393_1/2431/SZX68053.1